MRKVFWAAVVGLTATSASGQATLFSIEEPNDHFALHVEGIGDVDGDGTPDVAVANHRYHTIQGQIAVYSGTDGTKLWQISGASTGISILGFDFTVIGDVTGDGIQDMVSRGTRFSGADGSILGTPGPIASSAYSIVATGDADNDGTPDYYQDGTVYSGLDGSVIATLATCGTIDNGAAGPGDVDGDGHPDIIVVCSQVEIFTGFSGALVRTHPLPAGTTQGVSVTGLGDLDGDGANDYAVSALDGMGNGVTEIYDGLTSTVIGTLPFARAMHSAGDYDGDGDEDLLVFGGAPQVYAVPEGLLLGTASLPPGFNQGLFGLDAASIGDITGDGRDDLAVVNPFSVPPVGGGFSFTGAVHVYASDAEAFQVYCTAKTNSLGCVPAIQPSGIGSASGATPFNIDATMLLNFRPGFLFYGYGTASIPFFGGTLCVQPPLRRTFVQSSGGNQQPANDCSGTFAFDFAAYAASGTDPLLVSGVQIAAQYWSRDPASPGGIGITDAVTFPVGP